MNKEKWEIKYEEFTNGGLEKERTKLKEKHENGNINNKQYAKELKALERIEGNLPKIKNLIELRKELEELKEEIEIELFNRENDSKKEMVENKLNKSIEDLDTENGILLNEFEDLTNKLKDTTLSDEDRKELQEKLNVCNGKRKINSEKYNVAIQQKAKIEGREKQKTELSDISNDELKINYQKICMKSSRNNFYGKRLIKGQKIDFIKDEEKKGVWNTRIIDMKKLIANGENARKLRLSQQNKTITTGKKDPNGLPAKISEFDKKHPKLAKIKRFFEDVKNKILKKDKSVKSSSKDPNEPTDPSTSNKDTNTTTEKTKDFRQRLKDLDNYDISSVAENGLDKAIENGKEEKMSEAKKRLLENKQKSAEEAKAKYEKGMNDYYNSHNINKTKTDNTNYLDNKAVDNLKEEGR